MDEVLVFQHDPFEDLGFFAEVLEKQGASFRTIRLFHGEVPAEDWEQTSALIILGGPMIVSDFNYAAWAGGFVTRLSSRKRCGVSMAWRWFWFACRRAALSVVHLL